MSFILDALNKAEREDSFKKKPVPDLTTSHGSLKEGGEDAKYGPIKLPLWMLVSILVLLVVLLGLLLAVLLQKMEPSPSLEIEVPVVAEYAAKVPVMELPLESSQRAGEQQPVTESQTQVIDPEIQALYEGGNEPPVPKTLKTAEPRRVPESVDSALAQALWDASEIQQHTPLPEGLRQTGPNAADPVTITPEPKEVLEEDVVVDAPIEDTLAAFVTTPFLHELSVNFQNSIPSLMYSEHQYVNGYVVLNRQTLQAGDNIGDVQIEKILADGVILKYKDKMFKLASLSSWVNY